MPNTSNIAYTRWEPVSGDDEENSNSNVNITQNQQQVQFHRFEQEDESSRRERENGGVIPSLSSSRTTTTHLSIRNPIYLNRNNRNQGSSWYVGIRFMTILVIFGLGWIVGFMVRWGVHRYYIDPNGHCLVPIPYSFSPEIAEWAQGEITSKNIRQSFENFTRSGHHRAGTEESEDFAKNITRIWKEFSLDKVEKETINVFVTEPTNIPTKLEIFDSKGVLVWNKTFTFEEAEKIAYSADAIGRGQLVYGHFGQYSDFIELRRMGLNFTDSIVLMKTNNQMYHPGSMVRNAQSFGARGVILFPDPISYILTQNGQLGQLPRNASVSQSVKFFPGDPLSPYYDATNRTMPSIPVISINFDDAYNLMTNFVNAVNVSKAFWYGLPLNTKTASNFTAKVEVHNELVERKLHNVIGTIPGRYEPTRYVIIGSHHDTWHQGASKPGIGHSVLMELVRSFGMMHSHGWFPGRSIIFASWDGEELGSLGATSWIYSHSKELNSRAVAYIDLDYLVQGSDNIYVAGSPLLREIIEMAAKEVDCDLPGHHGGANGTYHTLYDAWLSEDPEHRLENTISTTGHSPFQTIFGVSSLEITFKNKHSKQDSYPFVGTEHDTAESVIQFLDPEFRNSALVGKFVAVLVMLFVMSPKLPISAHDYGVDIQRGAQKFFVDYADVLSSNGLGDSINDIQKAVNQFGTSASRFRETYTPGIQLEFLGHHEYNDQLLELERAFLLPSHVTAAKENGPFRHVIHGPSPTNVAKIEFFPRLKASIEYAKAASEDDPKRLWDEVKREIFFIVDALESGSCVLDNHLVYTYVSLHESLRRQIES